MATPRAFVYGTPVSTESSRVRVLLMGAGSLGRAFLRRLAAEPDRALLVGVATAHHGRRVSPSGLDPTEIISAVEADGLGTDAPADVRALLELSRADVLVDCVPQNVRSGEPSLSFLRAALDSGVHAVTANKSAVALGWHDLKGRVGRAQLRYEAAVLDGLPLFTLLRSLPDVRIRRVRGVLNGTSSLVFESVQNGASRTRGLARAQAQGIAEADAVLDLDGWDAAAKAALFANVWMGAKLRIVDVVREGTDAVKDDVLKKAAATHRYRLVAEIVRSDEGAVRATVKPEALEPGDPLYALRGSAGGVVLETSHGTFTLLQQTHGLDDATTGLFVDLAQLPR